MEKSNNSTRYFYTRNFEIPKYRPFYNWSFQMFGEVQNLERRNIERPIFRNFKITNIEIKKDELIDSFIFE